MPSRSTTGSGFDSLRSHFPVHCGDVNVGEVVRTDDSYRSAVRGPLSPRHGWRFLLH